MTRNHRKMNEIRERNSVRDNPPPSLNERCQRLARNAWLCACLAMFGLAMGLVMVDISNGHVLTRTGFAISVFAVLPTLVFAAERVRLKGRYHRLQREALIRWTHHAQEVLIGRDAVYYDGVLIEWSDYVNLLTGFSHVLTEAVWSHGSVAFTVERCAKGECFETVWLSIPVPTVQKEKAQQALRAIHTPSPSGPRGVMQLVGAVASLLVLFCMGAIIIGIFAA